MDTTSKFQVRIHPLVKKQDLPRLPRELRQDFYEIFVLVLETDPYECNGLPCHTLARELAGWRTMDIDECGVAYRLVYKISDSSPKSMRVDIVSFDIHDPAYDKAKERTRQQRITVR